MGRPIKKEFMGINEETGNSMIVIDSAFIPGASNISSNVSILQQKGSSRYIVTDGTNTGYVDLVDGSNNYKLQQGEAIMKLISIPNPTMTSAISSMKINKGGTGYKENDSLVIPEVGSYVVTSVSDKGAITNGNYTITNNDANNAGTNISLSGGSGKGATIDITTNNVIQNEYIRKLYDRTLITFSDISLPWSFDKNDSTDNAIINSKTIS